MKQIFIYSAIILFLISCKQDVDLSNVKLDLKVTRLEDDLFAMKDSSDVRSFLSKNPNFCKTFYGTLSNQIPSEVSDMLLKHHQNPEVIGIYKEAKEKYVDITDIERGLTDYFRHVKYYYPDFKAPQVYTFVSGFNYDLIYSDSLLFIGLDYFLGPNAKNKNPNLYEYFLKRYDRPYIVPMIGLAASGKYNNTNPAQKDMLSDMIYYGKAHYFLEKMIPDLPDSLNIMYSAEQIRDVNENVQIIWTHFLEKKLLYEHNHFVIQKYIGESPKVSEIGDKCPGRIGRWLGWQIVRKYMEENPEVTIPQLMSDTDAQKIFRLSKYKPSK